MPADPPPPLWAARLTAPTPPELVAAEAGLVTHLERTAGRVLDGAGIPPEVRRQVAPRVVEQLLDAMAALDADVFGAAWHRLTADYARRVAAPPSADLVERLDADLGSALGHQACLSCGVRFVPVNLSQRFCSTRCRVASHRAAQRP